MNLVFKTKFRTYESGNRVHIPGPIVNAAGLKHGDELEVDYINGVITIKKKEET